MLLTYHRKGHTVNTRRATSLSLIHRARNKPSPLNRQARQAARLATTDGDGTNLIKMITFENDEVTNPTFSHSCRSAALANSCVKMETLLSSQKGLKKTLRCKGLTEAKYSNRHDVGGLSILVNQGANEN